MSVTLTLHSQGSPPRINAIPVELLSSIFRFARAKSFPHLGTTDLHRQNLSIVFLTAVCRHWRAVAVGDAILWCNIAFSTSRLSTVKCATEFLRRSRVAMIAVQIFDIKDAVSYVAEVSDLVGSIVQQSNRIARFEAVGLSQSIAKALAFPACNLTRLTIHGRGAEEIPLIFDGRMPRLKRITLSNPSGWYLRMFPDITRVELFGTSSHLRLSSLMDFLDGATSLEQLSLSGYCGFKSERRKVPRGPVALPSLRELRLSLSEAPRILDYLDLPSSTHVSILAGYNPNGPHVLNHLPSAGRFHRLLYDTRTLSLTLHPTSDEFHLVTRPCNNEPTCFLQVYDDRKRLDERWVLRSVDAIAEFKPFFRINTLNLSIERCAVPWRQWLPQLDHLVSADIYSTDVGELALALSRTHPRRGGAICPSLRYLSVKQRGCGPALDSSVLKLCLLTRSQAGHPISWLRFRTWDWTPINQTDLGWKVLIRSQSGFSYTP